MSRLFARAATTPDAPAARRGMLFRLRRNLSDLLRPSDSAGTAAAARPAAPAAMTIATEGSFEDRLRQMLRRSGETSVPAGRVNFIGLTKIRERMGEAWQAIAADADRVARATIKSHLEPGDIYTSVKGLAYIMVFARPNQTLTRCRAIADAIASALLGAAGTELLVVKTAIGRIDGGFDLRSLPLADRVKSAFADAEPLEMVKPHPAPPSAPQAVAPPQPRASAPPASALRGAARDLLENVRFVYRPVWDKSRDVVSAYCCAAQVPLSDIGNAMGDAAAMIGGDRQRAQLDQMIQQRVFGDLNELVREDRPLLLVMRVHFETLSQASTRRDFLQAMGAQLNDRTRRLLLVEVEGVPEGVVKSRLAEILVPVKAQCRGVVALLRLEVRDFAHCVGAGIFAVATDLGGRVEGESALMPRLAQFARAAQQAGFKTGAMGLDTISKAATAVGAGFDFLSGDAVAKPIARPREVVALHLEDIYRAIAAR